MNTLIVYKEDYGFEIGRAVKLQEGEDVCFITTGSMVSQAMKVAKPLYSEDVSCSILNMHTIKSPDKEAILEADQSIN